MKILILGHGQHGKDTVAEILLEHRGVTFFSSSQFACVDFIFDALKDKYGYATPIECFNDRRNHRGEWYELISAYNKPDRSRLASSILASADCYVGMRCNEEFAASRHLFDAIFWVDAFERLPADPTMRIELDKAMSVIDNNGTKESLCAEVLRVYDGKI